MFHSMLNGWQPNSFANRFRRDRFKLLRELTSCFEPPVTILDIGGVHHYWLSMDLSEIPEYHITFLNKWPSSTESALPNSSYLLGDGRNMPEFEDDQFDIVFSNSVIEHVGGFRDQKRMADEVLRVGKSFLIQTPNRHFPIEPHFHLPMFQYYPFKVRAYLHTWFNLGWWEKADSYYDALQEIESIRLLSQSEFTYLFPSAEIVEEKFMTLTKSFSALGRPETATNAK